MDIKSISCLLLPLCVACVSCDDFDNSAYIDYTQGGGAEGGWGGASSGSVSQPSGDFSSFDISINDLDSFTDAEDVVVKDKSDAHYEDYLENSSFTQDINIVFDGNTALFNELDGVSITADGAYVTVISTIAKVHYTVSGSTSDGGLKIYSDKKFLLSLSNASILSSRGSAINIQSSKRVFLDLPEGSVNKLEDASKYTATPTDEDEKATLFSEGQIIFSGTGSLSVTGNYKHAICSDDYIMVRPGVQLSVPYSSSDALHSNDAVYILGGHIELAPNSDGIDTDGIVEISGGLLKIQISADGRKAVNATGNILVSGGNIVALNSANAVYEDKDITSPSCLKSDSHIVISGGKCYFKSTGRAGKGVSCDSTFALSSGDLRVITTGSQYVYSSSLDSSPKGVKAEQDVTISGGTLWIKATGGEGAEALESKTNLTVNDGEVVIYSYDDCINSKKSITFNGGKVYCTSTGNDGIDSNGILTVNGGLIISSGTTQPEEGFDCDQNTFRITGGTILGVGGATSSPTSSVCTQNSVIYGGSGTQGAVISICDTDGKVLMSYVLPRTYSQMTLLYSSPSLTNSTFNIVSGGTLSGASSFFDFSQNGTISGHSSLTSFTVSSVLTTVGNTSSMGGPGGGGPGGGGPRW